MDGAVFLNCPVIFFGGRSLSRCNAAWGEVVNSSLTTLASMYSIPGPFVDVVGFFLAPQVSCTFKSKSLAVLCPVSAPLIWYDYLTCIHSVTFLLLLLFRSMIHVGMCFRKFLAWHRIWWPWPSPLREDCPLALCSSQRFGRIGCIVHGGFAFRNRAWWADSILREKNIRIFWHMHEYVT